MRRHGHSQLGHGIAEFAAALILAVLIFFPLLDLLTVPAIYLLAAYYNTCELKEIARAMDTGIDENGGVAHENFTDDFKHNALARFLFHGEPETSQFQCHVTQGTDAGIPTITNQTTITAKPFLYVPYLPNVPGMSTDLVLVISQTCPREK